MKIFLPVLVAVIILSCQPKIQQSLTETITASETPVLMATEPVTNVDVATFAALMKKKNVIVLDVRTPEETAAGKIEGAIEIDFLNEDFAHKVSQLNRKKTYLVYCRSGKRSTKATQVMAGQGFTKIFNLTGGYNAWSVQENLD